MMLLPRVSHLVRKYWRHPLREDFFSGRNQGGPQRPRPGHSQRPSAASAISLKTQMPYDSARLGTTFKHDAASLGTTFKQRMFWPRFLVALLILLTSLTLHNTSYAANDFSPTKATPEHVLDLLHVSDYLAEAEPAFSRAITRRKKEAKIADADVKLIEGFVKRIYPARNLMTVFRQAYAKAVPPETITEIQAWLITPIGLKFQQALTQVYATTSSLRQAFLARESANVMRPNRQNAFKTFSRTFGQESLYGLLHSELDFGTLMALNALKPAAERDQQKLLKDHAKARRSILKEAARPELDAFNFSLLKDLKNSEIDELSKFAQSTAGTAHLAGFTKALEVTLDGAAVTLAEQIAKTRK